MGETTDWDSPSTQGGTGTTTGRLPGSIDEARMQAADLAGRVKEQGKQIAADAKDNAAGHVDRMAHALHRTAGDLAGEHATAGRYVAMAADQVEKLGNRLRAKDIDGLIDDAQAMGRRSPGLLFAGAVAAGFMLARFFRASGERSRAGASAGPDWQDTGPAAYDLTPEARVGATGRQFHLGGSHGEV
jgi:hypothetical protein